MNIEYYEIYILPCLFESTKLIQIQNIKGAKYHFEQNIRGQETHIFPHISFAKNMLQLTFLPGPIPLILTRTV